MIQTARHPAGSPATGYFLNAWPVLLPFAAYLVWWVLGIGDFIWLLAGLVVVLAWVRLKGLRIPRVLLVWFAFLAWVAITLVMNDSQGRVLGAVYRLLLYTSAGLLALYVYNARHWVTLPRVTGAMVWFLAGMTLAGYLALAFPEAVIRTPMSYLVPAGLASNELIGDMVVRNLAHFDPAAWVQQDVRPVAPFLYANTWGNVYSLVLPLALLHLWLMWHTRYRWPTLIVIVASVYPALATLNRGMFIGLGVVIAVVLLQLLRSGRRGLFLAGLGGAAAAAVALFASPFWAAMTERVESTHSTDDRFYLYHATFEAALDSPIFGYGAPRPAEAPWLPSLGTQGQLWTVLYSHGFIGAALFLGFFVAAAVIVLRRSDLPGAVLGGVVLATLVETLFYGMMTGIMVSMVAVALALRPDTIISSSNRPGTSGQSSATDHRLARTTRW